MFYVYVLRSDRDGELYIGSTNNLRKRFAEHMAGNAFSTKLRRPFRVIYYEAYLAEKDARLRESRLKRRGQARRQVMERIRNSIALL